MRAPSAFFHVSPRMQESKPRTAKHLPPIWLAVLCLLLWAGAAWGQATTSVRGEIADPSGAAVVGAQVTLTNTESKIERNVASGGGSEYQFLLLPPGTYTLGVTLTPDMSASR